MKRKYNDFWRKCQLLLIVAVGAMPAVFMLCTAVALDLLPYGWLFAAAFMAFGIPMLFVPGKLRIMYGLAACLLMILPNGLLLAGIDRIVALACSGFYGLLLMLSLRIAGWSTSEEPHPFVIGIFMANHLVCQFVWFIDRSAIDSYMTPVSGWIVTSFIGYLLLAMLSANRRSLTEVGEHRQGVTPGMRRKHVLMTVALIGVALLFAFVPSLFDLLGKVFRWISNVIDALRELFKRESSLGEQIPYETEPPLATEPYVNSNVEWLNTLAYYFCMAVGIPAIIYVSYKIIKRYIGRLRSLIAVLGRYLSSSSEDYEEEIIDIRDEVIPERIERKRRKRAMGMEPRPSTPVAYIRYRYLRLRLKHKEWKNGSTARENLPEALADVYERARYSDHPVTEEEAIRFKAGSKTI